MDSTVSIRNTTKGKVQPLPFVDLKNKILGRRYELSIAFVGTYTARKINIQSRNKTYTPNTLSFPYDKNSGEIILCPIVIAKQAKQNGATYKNYLAFIVIHSMLHLKGMEHGATMELLEGKYLKAFNFKI
jgi:probable rRNA maturation factor